VWPVIEGLLWLGVVLGYVAATAGRSGSIGRWLALPGVVSYSLYLLHYPVVRAVAERAWRPTGALWVDAAVVSTVVVLPIAAALATLCYLTVERPFMERRGVYLSTDPA
jgi:peptidoglycan/LPS O-acetylase OafA/YrhL